MSVTIKSKNDNLTQLSELSEPVEKSQPKPQGLLSSETFDLPGYRFIRKLGHGSQGDVFLAERESDGLLVAIKKLNISSVKNWKEYELFHREAEVLSSLDIDGVAKFYDAIDRLEDEPPCSYIIQEYIDGRSLANMLKAGHRFTVGQVYEILIQLIGILSKLHEHQPPVIHRDIKPSNILLKTTGDGSFQVYLIDFGAVANPQVQGGGSTMAGTFGYMPPEQLMGKPVAASDIYALAAVGVQLFTGKSPADMIQKDFRLIFEPEMQSYPVELVNTLRSMLEPDPQKRLSDHRQLLQLFMAFQKYVYAETGSRQSNMSPVEYEKKLINVKFYGENGNLELWQELSDVLPRNNFPSLYLSLNEKKQSTSNYHVEPNPVFTETSMTSSEFVRNAGAKNIYQKLLDILILILLTLTPIAVLIGIQYIDNVDVVNLVFGSGMMIGFLFLYCLLFLAITPKIFSPVIDKLSDKFSTKLVKSNKPLVLLGDVWTIHQDYINELLKNGRKTIATVVSVDYLPAKEKMIEQNLTGSVRKSNNLFARYCIHQSPLFKISYKFNPPDDEKIDDLVHEIYTHIEPENHYKVGDPLPILYRIYIDDNYFEVVDSMPFPIPLDDVFVDNNVFYHSDNSGML